MELLHERFYQGCRGDMHSLMMLFGIQLHQAVESGPLRWLPLS